MKSILQTNTEKCFICRKNGRKDPLDLHHVFFGANRRKSDRYGLVVYLCHNNCHIFGENSVHVNAEVCRRLQRTAQRKAMAYHGWTVEQFREIFGRNYLEQEE